MHYNKRKDAEALLLRCRPATLEASFKKKAALFAHRCKDLNSWRVLYIEGFACGEP